MLDFVEALYWVTLTTLIYVYLGYPAALLVLARRQADVPGGHETPHVSLIIPVHNEAHYIPAKIHNCLELSYPRANLEILLLSDGSTDGSGRVARACAPENFLTVREYPHLGKAEMLNEGARTARGTILVFSDVSALLSHDAIHRLVAHFEDANVDGVTGSYHLGAPSHVFETLYWKYEGFLMRRESRVGGLYRFHGSLYAVRSHLYRSLSRYTINDDDVIPLKLLAQGYRTVYESQAVSTEQEPTGSENLCFARRVRTMSGTLQAVGELRAFLLPLRAAPIMSYLSHGLLRIAVPVLLVVLLAANLLLVTRRFYALSFSLQLVFYILAAVGAGGSRLLAARAVHYFLVRHVPALFALYHAFSGFRYVKWR